MLKFIGSKEEQNKKIRNLKKKKRKGKERKEKTRVEEILGKNFGSVKRIFSTGLSVRHTVVLFSHNRLDKIVIFFLFFFIITVHRNTFHWSLLNLCAVSLFFVDLMRKFRVVIRIF